MAAALAALLLGGCDRMLSAERRIERAQQSYDEGRYREAMEDVKTALEAEPDNASGRVLLSRVSLKLGDPDAARKELDRAINSGIEPARVRDLHYEILLTQQRYDDALISAAADEGLPELRRQVILATAQTALGRYDEASASLDQALAIDGADREARLVRARLLWATGRISEAQEALDELLGDDPGFARGWLFKARFALSVGDATTARAAFAKTLEHATPQLDLREQVSAHAGLVESLLAVGDSAGAEAQLARLEQRARNAFITHYLRGRVAYAKGESAAAVASLQKALSQDPDNVPARLLLGAALLGSGAVEQAEAELTQLLAASPENAEARRLLARLYLSRNDAPAAERVLAEAPATETEDAATSWLEGATLLLSGKTAEAIVQLEQGATADPDNVPLKLDLVQAYLLAGRREDAARVLDSVPAGEGGARRRQLSVLAEVSGLPPAEAKSRVLRLADSNTGDAALLTAAGSYLTALGDAEGARSLYQRAIAADAAAVDARLGLAALSLQLRESARASEQLRAVLEIDPSNERAHLGLAILSLAAGDRDGARQWLERAISADPSVVEPRLRLAEMALADSDPARAKALVDQALAVTKARPATLNRVGQLYLGASFYDEALARFNDAAGLGLTDAEVGAALSLIALGRKDEARARLEAAAAARPDWAGPVVYLAALDSSDRRFEQALKRIDAFEKAGGPGVAADEIRGDVLTAAGRGADAAAAYGRAAAVRPSSGLAIKEYGARRSAGDRNPERSLTKWLERSPQDQTVRVLLAEHYQLNGNRRSAITEYEKVMSGASAPAAAVMNNLAWLYHETGDDRAEDLARRAYEAAPQSAEIADTYGWILVEKGKVADGLRILETAAGGSEHPEIRYHHAAALARAGQAKTAAEVLRSLLRDVESFPARKDAQALLDSLSRKELGL